ncbi:CheR family methyltransferase [Marinicellulosiphila megalodicopiae]|uniref:CheR family methyltransferase n=1 Tax=Marinicellulosiphila megalodicopiae TaxID=2724896 RepID=UPI003BB05D4E
MFSNITSPANNWSVPSIELDDQQFDQWRKLLEDRTGMQLTTARKSFLKTSLSMRMREIGCSDYQQYFELIHSGVNGTVEWYKLVDHLTVHETRFFRDPASFDLLKEFLLVQSPRLKRDIHIWSVGCSTGEEPYSLAMLAQECVSTKSKGYSFSLTATDISQPSLNTAQKGSYNKRKLVGINSLFKQRYFDEDGENLIAKSTLKKRMCFTRLNVLELDKSPIKKMDVIYCQNMLIYFRKWRRKEIVTHLVSKLAPGGMLILGTGELTDWAHPEMVKVPNDKTLAYLKSKITNELEA